MKFILFLITISTLDEAIHLSSIYLNTQTILKLTAINQKLFSLNVTNV